MKFHCKSLPLTILSATLCPDITMCCQCHTSLSVYSCKLSKTLLLLLLYVLLFSRFACISQRYNILTNYDNLNINTLKYV